MAEEHNATLPPEAYRKELKEAFTELDYQANQKVDVTNLGILLSKLGYKLRPHEVQKIYTDLDPYGTGQIEYDTYVNYFMNKEYEYVDNLTTAEMYCFDERDKSKAGMFSVELFRHMMTRLGQQMRAEDVDELIAELKTDGGYFKYDSLVKLLNGRK